MFRDCDTSWMDPNDGQRAFVIVCSYQRIDFSNETNQLSRFRKMLAIKILYSDTHLISALQFERPELLQTAARPARLHI